MPLLLPELDDELLPELDDELLPELDPDEELLVELEVLPEELPLELDDEPPPPPPPPPQAESSNATTNVMPMVCFVFMIAPDSSPQRGAE